MGSSTELSTAQPNDDEFPEGGYGWVCVLCIFMINAHTWGINSVSLPTVSHAPTNTNNHARHSA